jgi:TPR repeat protein
MNGRGALERAELIKWWDALDSLPVYDTLEESVDVERGLQMARKCQHPDSQWLAALFPSGVAVTRERMLEFVLEQGEDRRALLIAWKLDDDFYSAAWLQRSVEMGYAPAQAHLCDGNNGEFEWAQKAAAQGERRGLFCLASCLSGGRGCIKDPGKAIELFRQAAELGYPSAQHRYGKEAFGELDWERYHWWGRAAAKGISAPSFCFAVVDLLASFESGEHGRILHMVAPLIAEHLDVEKQEVFGIRMEQSSVAELQRVIELHEAMLDRARVAIACWSVVGRRCGVVKDIRVMISRMAWEEPWRWAELEQQEPLQPAPKRRSTRLAAKHAVL